MVKSLSIQLILIFLCFAELLKTDAYYTPYLLILCISVLCTFVNHKSGTFFKAKGKTILINTLEIPEIQKVADYCAVFYNGEIIKVLEHEEIDEMTVMMYSTNAAQAEEGK